MAKHGIGMPQKAVGKKPVDKKAMPKRPKARKKKV